MDIGLESKDCAVGCFLVVQYLEELSLHYLCGNFTTDSRERQLVIPTSHKPLKRLIVHCNNSLDFSCTTKFKTPSLVSSSAQQISKARNFGPQGGLHCIGNKGVLCIDRNEVKVLETYGLEDVAENWTAFVGQMQFLQVMKVELYAEDNKKLRLINHLLDLPNRSPKCQIQLL